MSTDPPKTSPPRRRLPAAERRALIAEAATALFTERGYHGTAIDEVARRAEVVPPSEKMASWWSYRAADFRKSNRGLRLDHLWTSPGLTAAVTPGSARIHDTVREWTQPSDHAPVTMDLAV